MAAVSKATALTPQVTLKWMGINMASKKNLKKGKKISAKKSLRMNFKY